MSIILKKKKKTEHESTLYVQMSECQHGCLHTRAPVIWIHSVTLAASGFHTNTQGPILKHPLKFQTISISFYTVSEELRLSNKERLRLTPSPDPLILCFLHPDTKIIMTFACL